MTHLNRCISDATKPLEAYFGAFCVSSHRETGVRNEWDLAMKVTACSIGIPSPLAPGKIPR